MNNTIQDFLQFDHIVEPMRVLAESFPLDGHEPDCHGWDTKVKVTGNRLDNAGLGSEIKITLAKQDGDEVEVRLTDLVALAVHGFKQIDKEVDTQ